MGIGHAKSQNKAETIFKQPGGIVQRPAAAGFPFMNKKLIRLAERRERLVAQAAAQRLRLAQNIEPWRIPLARADQGLAALRYIKSHPAWIVGGVALLAVLRPGRVGNLLAVLRHGRVGKWLGRGWVTWQMLHKLRGR